jgi:D-alanine--poly(phosphoribitol) ligase subunit 2
MNQRPEKNDMAELGLSDIENELRSFIRRRFQVSESDPEFSDDIHLFDYGYVDSFGAVELNTFVETTFSVAIRPTDLIVFPLNTIHEIGAFVAKRRAGEV